MGSVNWGDIMIAGAAVTAAGIAAWTANYRLRKQLAHDRELRVQDELRSVMDAAVEAVADAAEEIGRLYPMGKGVQSGEIDQEAFERAVVSSESNVHNVRRQWQRLGLRFPRTHELPEALWVVANAFEAALDAFEEGIAPTDQQLEDSREKYRESGRLAANFSTLCGPHVAVY
jgi:hypothetical protein